MEVTNATNTTMSVPGGMNAAVKPNAVEAVRQIESRIAALGPGPHTQAQKDEIRTLTLMLQKVQQPRPVNAQPNVPGPTPNLPILNSTPTSVGIRPGSQNATSGSSYGESKVVDKRRIQELVKEVDPLEQMDDDVEEMLMQIADDFIDSVVTASCQLAKHRKSNTVEVKDVQLHLERNWNMWIPGFGSEDLRPYKKAATTEAHKQRMALIKKTLKKY